MAQAKAVHAKRR